MTETSVPDLLQRVRVALEGEYRVERVVGQGGMGTVFLAHDLSLERPVAIKVISSELATSAEQRARFALEAKTVARLRHPNIVAIYAAGERDGLLYFIMEYVPGESLRERLTKIGRASPAETIPILHDLALALDYAHGAGVVHRDVKPENILLDGESGRAMLTDFGVARALSSDAQLTGVGFVLGSPRYMSPEQASGERVVDGRSDLYSLGLIGYEMLTGTPAIDGPSAASVLAKQLTERPTPLAQRVSSAPVALTNTIDRLLEKEPDARFGRGGEVAAALIGEPFDASVPSGQVRRSGATARSEITPAPRRRWQVGALLASVAALVAVWIGMRTPAGNAREWFIAPFEVQSADRSLDWLREGSLNMLTLTLSQWEDLRVVDYARTLDLLRDARLDETARVGLDDARRIAKGVGVGRVVLGQITMLGDSIVVTANLYNAADGRSETRARAAASRGSDPRPLFESIATQLLQLAGAPSNALTIAKQTTTSVEAYRHYLDGLRELNAWRLSSADSAFDRAIRADSTFALAYFRKSLALGWRGTTDTNILAAARRAVDFIDRLPKRQQELLRAHADFSFAMDPRTGSGERLAAFHRARSRLQQLVGEDTSDAEGWYALADANYHLVTQTTNGQSPDSVAKYFNQSLRAFERTIRLDSTFHLAYSHLVNLFERSSFAGSFALLSGDSIVPGGDTVRERRVGSVEEVAALRRRARSRARQMNMQWIAADPDAVQPRKVLAQDYETNGPVDSAVLVMQEALRRPLASDRRYRWQIPLLKLRAGALPAFDEFFAVSEQYVRDSLSTLTSDERQELLLSEMSARTLRGQPAHVDAAAARLSLVVPTLTFVDFTTPSAPVFLATSGAMRAAMGLPVSRSDAVRLTRMLDDLSVRVPIYRPDYLPYVLFTATRDSTFVPAIKRWAPQSGYPEVDARLALMRGDTSTAQRIAAGFPTPDSLRRSNIGMNGARVIARAEVLAELGALRQAAETYEAIDVRRFTRRNYQEPGWGLFVRSYVARGRLYEQLGDRAKAMAAYERFLALWAEAEAPLQPQLRDARAAIARLKDVSRQTEVGGAVRR